MQRARKTAPSVTIIDDNEYLTEFLEARFRTERWSTARFTSGDPALRHVAHKPTDCILLDVELGRECGFNTLEALRADPRTAHLKVIMLTANHQRSEVERARSLGVVDYVAKPFDLEGLVRRISRHLTPTSNDDVLEI